MTAGDVLVLGCLSRKLEGSCEARAPRTRAVVQGLQETECPLASVPSAGPLLFSPRPNMSLPPPPFFLFYPSLWQVESVLGAGRGFD